MSTVTLLQGDCLQKLKELKDNSIDSVVTDPPYEIGFMGKSWDDSGIANNPELWKEVLRVLKPGGHLLSFSHSRTYHRQAVAVEDAGFEIRDQILWIYGSGFPKSHNIGKAVDKIGGNNISWFGEWLKNWRTENNIPQSKIAKLFPSKTGGLTGCVSNWELGKNIPTIEEYNKIVEEFDLPFKTLEELEREIIGKKNSGCFNSEEDRHTIGASKSVEVDITKGNSPYEGWGTALKPAHEPIVMARKPFKGSVAQNVLEWGTGGINIDGCRIGNETRTVPVHSDDVKEDNTLFGLHPTIQHERVETTQGRFPANIIFDEEAGKILDKKSGITSQGHWPKGKTKGFGEFGGGESSYEGVGPKDLEKGGASRFFYCPKASKKDRNEGCDELEEKQVYGDNGATYQGLSDSKIPSKNSHPTVKPTALMAYLVRMVTPKGGTVLDPFMGSGSTGKASVREGFNFVGIEREDEYMEIAKSRIEHEQGKHNHRKFFDE